MSFAELSRSLVFCTSGSPLAPCLLLTFLVWFVCCATCTSLSAWEKKRLVPRSAMCCLFFSLGCLFLNEDDTASSQMKVISSELDSYYDTAGWTNILSFRHTRQQERCRQKHYNRCVYELQAVLRLQLHMDVWLEDRTSQSL